MANVRGGEIGEKTRPRSYVVEEFDPLSTCAEVWDCHYLIFSLPGFKKEDVRIQVLDSGDVSISGEKRVNDQKYMHFEKKFKVPENCAVTKSVRELEGHVFYVIFPKKVIEWKRGREGEKENPSFSGANNSGKENRHGRRKDAENVEKESAWKSAEKMARQHKGLILTALVAISLALLVSHRMKSPQFN